jgi:hypothetical protein
MTIQDMHVALGLLCAMSDGSQVHRIGVTSDELLCVTGPTPAQIGDIATFRLELLGLEYVPNENAWMEIDR